MKFSCTAVAAFATFLPRLAYAHLYFVEPPSVFKGNDGTDNFPLDASGGNYPCGVVDFSSNPGLIPTFQPGSQQHITLKGSAVHGGGSCQISITYDLKPTKSSVFRVVKSFEGGCPVNTAGNLGNDPELPLPPLPFDVPDDLPSGPCVVAWTWFNRIGNREMYMRCAPIKIGGSNTDTSGFDKLPEIFKANVGSVGNGCITKEGINIKFPNPGPVVVGSGDAYPDGPGCPAPGSAPGSPPPAHTTSPAKHTPVHTKPAQVPTPSPTYVSKPVLVKPPTTTEAPAPSDTPTSSPPSSPPSNPPSEGTSCPTNGAIVCTSENTWAVCNFGVLVPMGPTAAGTKCEGGEMVRAKEAKRSIRFSIGHLRRRHQHSHL